MKCSIINFWLPKIENFSANTRRLLDKLGQFSHLVSDILKEYFQGEEPVKKADVNIKQG